MKSQKYPLYTTPVLFLLAVFFVRCTPASSNGSKNDFVSRTPVIQNSLSTAIKTVQDEATYRSPAAPQQIDPTILSTLTTPHPTVSATETYEPTIIPAFTPRPTFPPDEAEVFVVDLLLQDSRTCRLPCWWGLIPGTTTWGYAENWLAPLAAAIEVTSQGRSKLYSVYLPVPKEIDPSTRLVHEYWVHNDVVEMIELTFGAAYNNYTLPKILSTYGQPEEIWIRTFESSRERVLPFYIVLFYPSQGIMVRYYDNAETMGDRVLGCPQQEGSQPLMWLWSPTQPLTFMEAAAQTVNFGLDEEKAYLVLEEATGMSTDTFYQNFKNVDTTYCLETPIDLWPPPV